MKFRLNGLPPRGICIALTWVWAMAGLLAGYISTATSQEPGVITFDEALPETGIGFVHFAGDSGKNYLYETVLSGIVTFDYDSDGWIDLLLLSGTSKNQSTYGNRLYRNLGGWRFVDVTESAGIRDDSFSLGATVGDYDNDGDPDLFLNNFGRNVLYCNQGDGSFVRSNIELISQHERVGAGASFLDIDQDGYLDLWVGNYIKFNRENRGQRLLFGVATADGPKAYPPDNDQLFRNDQNGRFEDVSESSGIGKIPGATMGMIAFDYDRDGDTDVFVCNDSMENFLWQNQGSGQYQEIAKLAGVAYSFSGNSQASMGVDCADIDRDGFLDLVATNFDSEIPNVYHNSGRMFFDDKCLMYGLGSAARDVKWGVALSDFDRDGFPDLFIATGHLINSVQNINSSNRFAAKNRLFRNVDGKRFKDVGNNSGRAMQLETVGRGVAVDDLDEDGDLDVVVNNLNDRPTILKNTSTNAAHWIKVRLVGTQCNREGVGSQVKVKWNSGSIVQEVHRGRGYQSHYGSDLFFGLGPIDMLEEIEVWWHGGEKKTYRLSEVDRLHVLVQ